MSVDNLARIQLNDEDVLVKRLQYLSDRVGKFLCGCGKWHRDEERTFDWPRCNHMWNIHCAIKSIQLSLSLLSEPKCAHSDCMHSTMTMKEVSALFSLMRDDV